MERITVLLLSFCLLAACSSLPISQPLTQTKTTGNLVQWLGTEPVTRCEATTLTDFFFVLHENGEWQSTTRLKNTDLQRYRPYWNDHVKLQFLYGTGTPVTLNLFTEKTRAASIHTTENSGVWGYGRDHFNDLKSATVTVVHNCEGLKEK